MNNNFTTKPFKKLEIERREKKEMTGIVSTILGKVLWLNSKNRLKEVFGRMF